jgi:hypothetical protein
VSDIGQSDVVQTPNPVSTEPRSAPEAKPEPEKKEAPSARDAIRKAREQVNAREKDGEGDAKPADRQKPVQSDARTRAEDGKFAAKDGKPADQQAKPEAAKDGADAQRQQPAQRQPEAKPQSFTDDAKPQGEANVPSRFHEGAKAEWEKTPQSVRSEVARMEREFTEGYRKYRESAEAFEPVRKFHDMAKQGGTTLDQALTKYVNLENLLRADVDQGRIPIRGLEEVCRNFGMSLRDVAAVVLGQPVDQQASHQDATIRELRNELATLKEKVGGVENTFQTQQKTATLSEIEAFAAQNPRFEELSEDIAFFLESKRAKDLAEAYSLAEKLNPAPSAARGQEPSAAQSQPSAAQTGKGEKSITGAPSSGSDPVTSKRPSSSIREALRRAKMAAG